MITQKSLQLKNCEIGGNNPCYIIAEMSANHAGSLKHAIRIVQAAKDAGANCIKIQTYTPDTMTLDCDNEYFKISQGAWRGETFYSLYKKAHMPWEWQGKIKEEAEKLGLDFLSTPFDKSSVDFLESLSVDFYKIASFELTDIRLLRYIAQKGRPIILSTGMASLSEIEEAVNTLRAENNDQLCLLKCSSDYPAVPENMNLMTMPHLAEAFKVVTGLSDHTLGSSIAVTAVALGAKVIEKHLCMSRNDPSPDQFFSMEPIEFKQMVQDIRTAEKAIGRVNYDVSEREKANRLYRRSIFVSEDIKAGACFGEENIKVIRPSNGMSSRYFDDIIGKKATKDLQRGTPLKWEHVGVE